MLHSTSLTFLLAPPSIIPMHMKQRITLIRNSRRSIWSAEAKKTKIDQELELGQCGPGKAASLGRGATQIPVALSVSFGYEDVDHWLDVAQGKTAGHIYSRNTNPTVAAFEEKIRDLETAEAATSFASGMAAISNTLFALLSPGDRVVSIRDTYGGNE